MTEELTVPISESTAFRPDPHPPKTYPNAGVIARMPGSGTKFSGRVSDQRRRERNGVISDG